MQMLNYYKIFACNPTFWIGLQWLRQSQIRVLKMYEIIKKKISLNF